MLHVRTTVLALAVATAACMDPGPPSFGDDLSDPELPPRGTDDVQGWLAAGYYQAWRCEPARHAGRSPSAHGTNRICNNTALHAAGEAGPFPVGAAAVKEIFEGTQITLYAVMRKMDDGAGGDSWYWYEGGPSKIFANGEGADNCTGCHAGAGRDFVFTVVP